MPPKKGPLWEFFHQGEKKNSSHYHAFCLACLKQHQPEGLPIELDENGAEISQITYAWFKGACENVPSINGEKSAMIAHLIGSKRCPHASKKARKVAKQERDGKGSEMAASDGNDELSDMETHVQKTLKFPKGLNIPFTPEDVNLIKCQFIRATISANLPFHWTSDAEVIKLFLMMRSHAGEVIPERRELAGCLLNDEHAIIDEDLHKILEGEYVVLATDGWKDKSRNSVTGVNASIGSQSYLIDLKKSNKDCKDGPSMSVAFERMIDETEEEYKCIVVVFVTDDDGGSSKGHKLLVFQFRLALGDYFKENLEAAETAESATEVLGWLLNHTKVWDIFDEAQIEKNGKALAYLTANLTRWTTHSEPLRHAAFLNKPAIIAAQVGAEKNAKVKEKMIQTATEHCELLESSNFWKNLQTVADDIEPICFSVNINQGDSGQPDHILLSLGGLYLHFGNHPNKSVATGMKKHLEKRWKAFDQAVYIFALVLNPFEHLDQFGDQSRATHLTLLKSFMILYRRMKSQSPPESLTLKEKESGEFGEWIENKSIFEDTLEGNPILFWESMKGSPAVAELVDFAIMLLKLVLNSAGTECTFSDLGVKKTCRQNRLGLPKLKKMSMLGVSIRTEHISHGLHDERSKRKNHSDEKIAALLDLPRYTLSNDSDSEDNKPKSIYIKSGAAWCKELKKWMVEEQEADFMDTDDDAGPEVPAGKDRWLPIKLEDLFGGKITKPLEEFVTSQARKQVSEEALRMELIAAEYSDEPPDDGELEGSGDDYA
ncbi:hypothetical protein BT96DRAFT_991320 [Gymnopus androsaceus JB14]|uniref:DUF659 domain-containing protein n=1 Tax=Gymnopus androsaceus JB14 TaxID=1447944 RepID=A0A6A4HYS0_9AGAR|nr:hypothetical protein BT96DRAFT_991320 [Gymnopus androsaceus JB14]